MENKKTLVNYVLILSVILFILLSTVFSLSRRSSSSNKNDKSNSTFPTPTSYPLNLKKSSPSRPSFSSSKSNEPSLPLPTATSYPLNFKNKNFSPSLTPTPVSSFPTIAAANFTGVKESEVDPKVAASVNDSFALRKQLPLKKGNLKIDFDYEKEVFVISPLDNQVSISDEEKQELLNWLKENYPNLDQQKIIYSDTPYISPTPKKININITPVMITPLPTSTTQENGFNFLVELFRILLDQPSFQANSSFSLSPYPQPSFPSSPQTSGANFSQINYAPPQTQYPYIYYPQRDGPFDKYPLPGGCTIRQAGCGPTTVAMIVASYKDKSVNPITIVNQYGSRVGCQGSSYLDAMRILRSYGLNVGSIIFSTGYYNGKKADEIAPELKKYLNAGKTIFALANFRADGGGHYFWIIDIDEKNNLWSFDPWYGRYQVPYNQNSRYPYPLYRLAFSVSP